MKGENINMAGNKKADLSPWESIRYFKPRDFGCKCEGMCEHPITINMDLVRKLDTIQEAIGLPIKINSGSRCARYNAQVVHGSPVSPHVPDAEGVSYAVDIHCPNGNYAHKLIGAAFQQGIQHIGIGTGATRGQYYVHLDISPRPEECKFWAYPTGRAR